MQLSQGLGTTRRILFGGALDFQNLAAIQVGGEHVACPIHQVVGLIDEETVCASLVGKVTPQINLRIKNVIVIADDGVSPDGHVQGKLEWADLMLLAHGFQNRAGDFFPFQGFADRGFDAVVITSGEGARQRITGMPFADADFFLGSERDGANFQSSPAQINQSFLGDGASDRAGRQVKDAFELSFSQRFDCREQSGDGFPDAGGGSEK